MAFLDAHGGGLTLNGVWVDLVPLAMTAAVVFIAWRAGRTLAEAADELSEPRDLLALLGVQTATYGLSCAVLVPFAHLGTTHVPFFPTVLAAIVVFGLSSGTAFALGTVLGDEIVSRLPVTLVRGLRATAGTLACYLAAGTLLTLGSLVLHGGRVMDLSRQVGGGLSGFPIMVLGVVTAPNAVVAGSSYLAGPGFAVGSGTSVDAFSTSHGVLPAFPLLGAVPSGDGANSPALALMALTALAVGVIAAILVRRAGAERLGSWCAGVGACAGATGVSMAVLAWLAGGSAGPGRLQVVGASPWQVGLASAAVVGVVGELIVLGYWGWLWLSERTHEEEKAPKPELAASGRR
jgi:hypothetical protein